MRTKLKQHLAIATGAVSAAAVPMGAAAGIIYKDSTNAFSASTAGFHPGDETRIPWDIDSDASDDFQLVAMIVGFVGLQYIYLRSNGFNARGLVAAGGNAVNNLGYGLTVGPTLTTPYVWAGNGNRNYVDLIENGAVDPFFGGGTLGSNYIGFRFLSGGNTLYGWAELILASSGDTVTVNRWAYNDTPDGSIKVGDTGQVPTPPTLALLAAGAFGLRRWRRQRAAA